MTKTQWILFAFYVPFPQQNETQYQMYAYATQITNLFTSRKQKMQNALNNFDDFLPIN